MTAAQTYWWLAPLISFLALVAVIWFQWGQHQVRKYRLRRGFRAFLAYGPTDSNEHLDLRLPANSKAMVQIRIRPRMPYRQIELVFGCEGPEHTRPIPLRVLNRFIKVGANRQQCPETHPNNYIDHGDHYHIGGVVDRAPPHTYALEFVMQTKGPGRYPVLLEIITEVGEAKPKKELYLTVIDNITGVVGVHLAEDEAPGSLAPSPATG
jgi:hypothetical protein